ncbi:hypothetical protein FOA52_008541 [Chlamydomonas sp. UWO 241]|nr:hypothetical protein FOA52_008541 [Chlamydomonas sp. UWO 241]
MLSSFIRVIDEMGTSQTGRLRWTLNTMFDHEIRHRAVVHYKYFVRSLRKVVVDAGLSR